MGTPIPISFPYTTRHVAIKGHCSNGWLTKFPSGLIGIHISTESIRGHYCILLTQTKQSTTYYKGNFSKIPQICINFDPKKSGWHLMTTDYHRFVVVWSPEMGGIEWPRRQFTLGHFFFRQGADVSYLLQPSCADSSRSACRRPNKNDVALRIQDMP